MARIGLDIDEAIYQATGIGQMIRMLVRGLLEIAPEHDYVLVYADQGRHPDFVDPAQVELCPIHLPRRPLYRMLWPLAGWPPVEAFTGPLDLFHVLNADQQIPTRCPYIVTVHDLFPELHPQHYKATGRWLRRSLIEQMRHAPHLIAISEAVRQESIDLLKLSPERITQAPLALPPAFESKAPDVSVLAEFDLETAGYFLCVGRVSWRKNTDNILRAFALYCSRYATSHKLVLAGSHSVHANQIFRLIDELHLGDRVIRTGYLPDTAIMGLYKNALAFVFPSRHEGFGMPVLEAQHYGVPVISSTAGALPEVSSGSALLVNPESPAELCEAMYCVASCSSLRQELVEKGFHNLARFDWRQHAVVSAQLYARLLSAAGSN